MPFLPAPADHAHGLLTFIEQHKIRVLRFASRQRQKTAGIRIPKHPDAIFHVCGSVGNGRQARRTRSLNLGVKCARSCFVFSLLARLGCTERKLARTTITSECKRCGGALDIQSPGRPRETTASEGY